jgi:hypothetical protein
VLEKDGCQRREDSTLVRDGIWGIEHLRRCSHWSILSVSPGRCGEASASGAWLPSIAGQCLRHPPVCNLYWSLMTSTPYQSFELLKRSVQLCVLHEQLNDTSTLHPSKADLHGDEKNLLHVTVHRPRVDLSTLESLRKYPDLCLTITQW